MPFQTSPYQQIYSQTYTLVDGPTAPILTRVPLQGQVGWWKHRSIVNNQVLEMALECSGYGFTLRVWYGEIINGLTACTDPAYDQSAYKKQYVVPLKGVRVVSSIPGETVYKEHWFWLHATISD
jgi:hypothetical protein